MKEKTHTQKERVERTYETHLLIQQTHQTQLKFQKNKNKIKIK